jgi:hypothetical protein
LGTFARESGFLPVSDTLPANYTGVIAAHLPLRPTEWAGAFCSHSCKLEGGGGKSGGGGGGRGNSCEDMRRHEDITL